MKNLTPTTELFANRCGYTDVHPYEIVRVVSDKTIEIRAMKAVRDDTWKGDFHIGGFSAHCANNDTQRWIITSDENNTVVRARLRKDGYFHSAGGRHSIAEEAHRFYDYNF